MRDAHLLARARPPRLVRPARLAAPAARRLGHPTTPPAQPPATGARRGRRDLERRVRRGGGGGGGQVAAAGTEAATAAATGGQCRRRDRTSSTSDAAQVLPGVASQCIGLSAATGIYIHEDILVPPLLRNCSTLMTFPFPGRQNSGPCNSFYSLGHCKMSMMMMMMIYEHRESQ